MKKSRTAVPFYGWIVLAATCVLGLTAASTTYAGSYIMTIMVMVEGFDSGTMGYAASIRYIVVALIAAPLGRQAVRRGNRTVMHWGLLVQLVTMCAITFLPACQWLMVLSNVLTGFSTCSIVALGCPGIVKEWFRGSSGLPMAIALSSSTLGGFIVPNLASAVIGEGHWRYGWGLLLALTLLSELLMLTLIREAPAENLFPDDSAMENVSGLPEKERGLSLRNNPGLLLYGAAFVTFSAVYACTVSYISMYTIRRGFSEETAAVILSLVSLMGVVGKMATSLLGRVQVSAKQVTVLMFLLEGAGCASLVFLPPGFGISLGAVCLGFGYNCCYAVQPGVLSDWFGEHRFSAVWGIYVAFIYIGCTLGPTAMTAGMKLSGGFEIGFLVLGGLVICGAAVCARVLPAAREREPVIEGKRAK